VVVAYLGNSVRSCLEGFQQNRSPGLDLNRADSHVKPLTRPTTTFVSAEVLLLDVILNDMIINLWVFSIVPDDKDFCSGVDYAMCADCALRQSRDFGA
jgi:hypothetical protein